MGLRYSGMMVDADSLWPVLDAYIHQREVATGLLKAAGIPYRYRSRLGRGQPSHRDVGDGAGVAHVADLKPERSCSSAPVSRASTRRSSR